MLFDVGLVVGSIFSILFQFSSETKTDIWTTSIHSPDFLDEFNVESETYLGQIAYKSSEPEKVVWGLETRNKLGIAFRGGSLIYIREDYVIYPLNEVIDIPNFLLEPDYRAMLLDLRHKMMARYLEKRDQLLAFDYDESKVFRTVMKQGDIAIFIFQRAICKTISYSEVMSYFIQYSNCHDALQHVVDELSTYFFIFAFII